MIVRPFLVSQNIGKLSKTNGNVPKAIFEIIRLKIQSAIVIFCLCLLKSLNDTHYHSSMKIIYTIHQTILDMQLISYN
jgi:hypothetical protein